MKQAWRDKHYQGMSGGQYPLADPHVDPKMARALARLLTTSTPERKGDWQRENEEDRARKRRPTRKDPEYARIEDALLAYPKVIEKHIAQGLEAFDAVYKLTEGLSLQWARQSWDVLDAGIAPSSLPSTNSTPLSR